MTRWPTSPCNAASRIKATFPANSGGNSDAHLANIASTTKPWLTFLSQKLPLPCNNSLLTSAVMAHGGRTDEKPSYAVGTVGPVVRDAGRRAIGVANCVGRNGDGQRRRGVAGRAGRRRQHRHEGYLRNDDERRGGLQHPVRQARHLRDL